MVALEELFKKKLSLDLLAFILFFLPINELMGVSYLYLENRTLIMYLDNKIVKLIKGGVDHFGLLDELDILESDVLSL